MFARVNLVFNQSPHFSPARNLFVLKAIKEFHTFYQHLHKEASKKTQPVRKHSGQFQPRGGASTVPETSHWLKEILDAILSLHPSAALRGLFASQLLR